MSAIVLRVFLGGGGAGTHDDDEEEEEEEVKAYAEKTSSPAAVVVEEVVVEENPVGRFRFRCNGSGTGGWIGDVAGDLGSSLGWKLDLLVPLADIVFSTTISFLLRSSTSVSSSSFLVSRWFPSTTSNILRRPSRMCSQS